MAQLGIQATATGTVSSGPTILYGIASALTTAGTLTLRDGGASGTVRATIDIAGGNASFLIPFGLRFRTDLHVTFTTAVGGVTFWV